MRDPVDVAIETAREAGALLMDYLHRPLHSTQKGRRADLVTDADHASERLIVDRLRKQFPESTIVGEEGGIRAGLASERWYVDPLDGTTNFTHGYPMFCVSIAYEQDDEVCAGVVYAPFYDELFVARRGAGATLNARPLRVSGVDRLADALVCTGFRPADFARNGEYFRMMSGVAQAVRRDGSAALDLAAVAAGRFDGFWEFDLSAWDVSAGALIVRESGGTVSQIDGGSFRVDGRAILATNGHVHDEMVGALSTPL
ncbi:MAG: inositol monophosphatase [Candidatus Eremiobacteraeota bacterium]|nr:inositol monophosphatase [Candidatus Eremiobacteraeota bacterium]